jgi:hypothetical protein
VTLLCYEITALRYFPAKTVFWLDCAPPYFSHCVHAFLDSDFPDNLMGRGRSIPWLPYSPDLTSLDFFWAFVEGTVHCEKSENIRLGCLTGLLELQSGLPMKCLLTPGEKLNIILMCVMPLTVSILRSTEHIRNFVKSSV